MAIKDQCVSCASYSTSSGCCSLDGQKPVVDGSSCESYRKKGINLEKTAANDVALTPVTSSIQSQTNDSMTPSPNLQSKRMFKHIFSFDGRIRRLEYGLTYLFYTLYSLPINIIPEEELSAIFVLLWLMLLAPVLWVLFAQGAKRCHDLGNSGWWQLIPFYLFWMIFQDGEQGNNEYGDNPKE